MEKKILYASTESNTIYNFFPLHIADIEDKSIQDPPIIDRGHWFGEGWIDENSYLLWDGGEGAPPHNFRYINTQSEQVTTFWKYALDGFVYLKDLSGIVSNIHPAQDDIPYEPGTYFISTQGKIIKISDDRFFPLSEESLQEAFFWTTYGRLYTFKLDGTKSNPMSENINPSEISVSPNKEWFVLTKNYAEVEIYSKNLQLIKVWDLEIYEVIWRPDSKGFFLRGNGILYYVLMDDKELSLIDVCPTQDCSFRDYVWIP
jgi:hypothetical protein